MIVAPPGEKFRYSGGDTMLLAAVIERATKQRLSEYAEQVLFRPLCIGRHEWIAYSDGTEIAASGLRLLPRDMARFGLLYLQGGRWRGTQVVPESWMKASTSVQAKVSDRSFGFQSYGYSVGWTARVTTHTRHGSWRVINGGQRVMLIPSRHLVMVVTAGLYNSPPDGCHVRGSARRSVARDEVSLHDSPPWGCGARYFAL